MASTLHSTPVGRIGLSVPGYTLLRMVSEGDIGRVYLARAEDGEREVAVRVLDDATAARPQAVQRYLELVTSLKTIESPNVIKIFEVGVLPAGAPFLVTERLLGRDLGTVLAESSLDPPRVISLARQTGTALAAIHRAGLVHLDLRPSRLQVTGDDELTLLDLGVPDVENEYAAPEQTARAPDARSNLYSLGAILHRALRGTLPAAPVDDTHPLDDKDLAPEIAAILRRLLQRDPTQRYASAEELRDTLPTLTPARPTKLEHKTAGYPSPSGEHRTLTPQEAGDVAAEEEQHGPGTTLGSYRLVELLGEGGMGRVFLAEHTRLGRRVALKLLRPELGHDPQTVSRFFAEARAVNRIQHENIVEITDFIENPGGDNYYIMEFLPGRNLDQVVKEGGPLTLGRGLGIAVQVCSALASVHEADIIHRDLKPENIFLTERGGQKDFVKVLDFGIAKLGEKDEAISTHKTGAGIIMGTPEYMSPEQASGLAIDSRSDIYAVGIILYELATGQNPFPGDNFGEMLMKRLTAPPIAPSKTPTKKGPIPPELDAVILQCLSRDRDARPQHVREVEDRLRMIAEKYAVELETFETAPPARAASSRTMIYAAVAAVVVLGAVGVLALRPHNSPPKVVTPPPVAAPAPPPVAAPPPTAVEPPVAPPVAVDPTTEESPTHATDPASSPTERRRRPLHSKKNLEGPGRHGVIDPFK